MWCNFVCVNCHHMQAQDAWQAGSLSNIHIYTFSYWKSREQSYR